MNVEKKKHLEKTYERILNVGFCIIPYEDLSDIISSDPMIYGTAKDERILSFEGVEALFKFQYEQIGNMKPSFNRSRIALQVSNGENNACIVEEITLKFSSDEENHSIFMRATCMMEYLDNKWKLTHWHTSTPVDTENDPWHMEEWKREKEKLQQLVDQQTATLRQNNRELQIEAALERVRSRSMAMTKSEQLSGVILEIHNKFKELDISMESRIAIVVVFDSDGKDFNQYIASNDVGNIYISTPYFEHPILDDFYTAKESGVEFFSKSYSEDEKNSYFKTFFETSIHDEIEGVEEQAKWVFDQKYYTHSQAFQKSSSIGMADYSGIPLNDSEIDIIKRFSKVFDQAYTRFLDLKKAEKQAREAKIETALERVRSRSMAMHNSSELSAVVDTLQKEFANLDFALTFCIINLINEEDHSNTVWAANPETGKEPESYYMKFEDYPFHHAMWEAWKARKKRFVYVIEGEEKQVYDKYLYTKTEFSRFPEHVKKANTDLERYTTGFTFFKHSGLQTVSETEISHEDLAILERFGRVFEQAYTRFLDLQKAEQQAKEAQIEAALERVRAQSMAMHNSEDVGKCIVKMFDELTALGVPQNTRFGIGILNHDNEDNQLWTASKKNNQVKLHVGHISMAWHPLLKSARKAWLQQVPLHEYILEGEDLRKYYEVLNEAPDYPLQINMDELPERQFHYGFVFDHGFFYAFSYQALEDHLIQITQRFSSLFAQTYRRYLDLKKAEAQAREAQIQLALERVRAKTMAMKTQSDLLGIVELFGQQLSDLDVRFNDVTFIEGAITKNRDWELWSHVPNADNFTHKIHIPYIHTPYFTKTAKAVEEYERTGNPIQTKFFSKEEKDEFLDHYWKYAPAVPEKIMDLVYSNPGSTIVDAFLEEVTVSIVRNDLEPFKDEELSIFERFAKEFKQTYIRFLDIKKAEEQAREAQIEAALERIRSRTMGMQSSEELPEVANLLFKEVQGLGIPAWSCGYNILAEDKKSATCCMSSEGTLQTPFQLRLWGEASFEQMADFIQSDQNMLVQELGGRALEEHYAYMRSFPDLKPTFDEIERLGLALPTYQINHLCKFNQGFILFITYEKVPHAHDIFKRFTKVFDQTYTRFLDLKKAESQARESQIEAALERVRSHSMGMQSTDDFGAVTTEMFNQLRNFGEDLFATGIVFCDKHDGHVEQWHSIPGGGMMSPMIVPVDLDYIHQYRYDQWKADKELFSIEIPSDFIQQHFEDIFKLPSAQITLEDLKSRNAPMPEPPPWEIDYGASFKHGYILISSLKHLENTDILPRFAKVFEQAYTRFLDLQTAEKNAYKSKVETALERVRARAMAMQEPHELKEVASVLRTEMGLLGIEELETCSIYILDDDVSNAECWYALKDAKSESKRLISDHISMDFTKTWVGQQMLDFHDTDNETTSIVMKGEQRREWIKYCAEQSKILQSYYGDEIPERTYHLQKFSNGAIGAASAGDISDESWALLKRSASVFSLAYSRFKDLTQAKIDLKRLKTEKKRAEDALSELQTTQKQLIQSEKMASLGELTAGIAHEIQNPLNFVNNFSEVSKELLEEMQEELENGDFEEVKAIMQDVIQNLEKINHHGKRADGIVKGMLQHSRAGNDKKEPTDINALADEYMRLAYHGLRAKDKSFNAELVTDFDESIGKIDIIPQDIGRVILNLLTNAFYAVNEKKKSPLTPASPSGRPKGGNTYKPIVKITTKKQEDKVIIKVTDNGKGIPDHVRDKIFQPFFTTKPTGQGTGLGLSMSYDIITKGHNGAFEVESIEGQSTTFRIILPLNKSNS